MKIDSQADLLHDDDAPVMGEYTYSPPTRRRFIPADSWQGIQHDDANRIVNNTKETTS